jgi:hypothetical protein
MCFRPELLMRTTSQDRLAGFVSDLHGKDSAMKKHLTFIQIGAAMGIIPALMLTFAVGRATLGFDWLGLVVLVGGLTGSMGGWIGGAISHKNWGAVAGGLVGTILGLLFAAMPS